MPQQSEPPRPHGDPLEDELTNTGEAAGRQVDSGKEPTLGTSSDANSIAAGDDADGERRRKLYDGGAGLVSKID